ncbi:HD-GYP domain-containing protein [Granulicella cerasi]|uniref:HD-GYP domain-containing protein n=1 Tax=Granulicella cerasi TaxID=741063 RepID=A0ABW1Z519_9BACT|nr:HD domain-containing phosphohydrolase [Granulicella cerasi]
MSALFPSREHILLVEPDGQARLEMLALLRTSGHETAVADTAASALSYLYRHPNCRIVLTEAALPDRSGFRLLDDIRRAHFGVAVVIMTANRHPHLAIQAFRRGAADILFKPLTHSLTSNVLESLRLQEHTRRQTFSYVRQLESLVHHRTSKLEEIMEDLERSYDITIEAMGDALDMRDEETEGHSKRVTAYTVALARHMNLDRGQLKTIARGAFLHDIGKIAIPDSILLKPGRLSDEEMVVMRSHCEQGYRIVRKIPFLTEAAEIVLSHQERYDGSGYPRALVADEIPLGARIFAVADTLDAITSDRPYRRGRSFDEAYREIERCRGSQFDPDVIDAFLTLPGPTWPAIRAEVGRQTHAAELVRRAVAA